MLRKSFLSMIVAGGLVLGAASLHAAAPTTRPERHPELHIALRHLREAKTNLEAGAHDFGGHRVAAVKATDAAIQEVEAALAFDKQ